MTEQNTSQTVSLTRMDMAACLRRMPKPVRLLLEDFPSVFIAGGFIRDCVAGEKCSDIDIFTNTPELAKALAGNMEKALNSRQYVTDNAITVLSRPPVQFIHRWTFASPLEGIKSFDFTVAQAAIFYEPKTGWTSVASASFYADLAAKRLVYTHPLRNEDAGGSIIRVLKMYQRGYRIPLQSLAGVVARLVGGCHKERREQFMSDEYFRTQILKGLLYEVDPNSDPSRYIIKDVDPADVDGTDAAPDQQ